MGEPYTYNKVHVAAKGQMDEASFHADMDDSSTNGFPVKHRIMGIQSADDLVAIFQKLIHEKFEIDYLDFHAHGYGGGFELDDVSSFSYDTLAQFRNRGFENLFRADAVISFMSCNIATVDHGKGEDGELFLTEVARTFLHAKGGRVIGRNKSWRYKPPLGLGLFPAVGPFTAKFKNDGAEIAAEIAANAGEATLRGNFRLDKTRLKQEIAARTLIITSAINILQADDGMPKKSYAPPRQTGGPMDDIVARYLNDQQVRETLKAMEKRSNNLALLNHALKSLDSASEKLKGLGQLYKRLHDASEIIDDQIDAMMAAGVPLSQTLPVVFAAIRSTPLNP